MLQLPTAHRRRPRHARTRARLATFMALVLLCWQMSLAAYACPVMSGGPVAAPSVMSSDMAPGISIETPLDMLLDSPCLEMMADDAAPGATVSGLCQQHCQFGATSQVANPVKLALPLATAWPPDLAAVLQPEAHSPPTTRAPGALAASMRPPPSHSLLHCCFRI